MPTRRELVERVALRTRARMGPRTSDDVGEPRTTTTLHFVRAMLAGLDDHDEVPEALLLRVAELLQIDRRALVDDGDSEGPTSRRSGSLRASDAIDTPSAHFAVRRPSSMNLEVAPPRDVDPPTTRGSMQPNSGYSSGRHATHPPTQPPIRPASVPPPSMSLPARLPRLLVLGRSDGARVPMLLAVARARFGDRVEARSALMSPVTSDARCLKALRQAGYHADSLSARALSVEDLAWADAVLTVGGTRAEWERFVPRNTPHEHSPADDPTRLASALSANADDFEPFRAVLRDLERDLDLALEQVFGLRRSSRSVQMPAIRSVPPGKG